MNKALKYNLLILLVFVTQVVNSQLLLPTFEVPQRMEILSTASEEIAPVPFLNGQSLYFVRSTPDGKAKERKAAQEIWTSKKNGENWSEPENVFKEANDRGNNGVIGSSADGKKIYVFNSIQSRRKLARGIAFVEKQDDGSWSDLKKLKIDGFEIGDGYYSFYMNQSEDVLLISMAPNRNTINEDLFVSTKGAEGKWSQVTSLGATINTPGVELSPFITEDKSAIYFASDGHRGEGDVDIFVSYRLGDGWSDWTTPKNLGPKINSSSFDAYFMIGNNKEVFFVSNRDSAMGDIYTTKLVEAKSVQLASSQMDGQFFYKGLPIENIKIEVYDEFGNIVDTVVTDEFGKFSYQKLDPEQNYFLKVSTEDVAEYPDAVFYELDDTGKKSSRFVLTKTGLFIDASKIRDEENVVGTFTYNNLPLENFYLLVYDENGGVVDTIITDRNGNFVYKKLDLNGEYTFKPLDITDSDDVFVEISDPGFNTRGNFTYKSLPLQNTALLVMDENGFPVDTIYTDKQGNFNYKKLKADTKYSFKPIDLKDDELAFDYTIDEPEVDVVKGTLKYNKLPLINVPLLVKDENGVIVDTVYTDVNGRFNYKKLNPDGNYFFEALDEKNDLDLVDFVFTEVEKEIVKGSFKYKNLPLQNEALVVMDENGFPIDTIYTDVDGGFQYEKLKGEKYTFQVLDDSDVSMVDLIVEVNGVVQSEEKEVVSGYFEYETLPMQNSALIVMDENGYPVDTIYTDETGRFQYEKLKGDTDYTFKLLNDSDVNLEDLVVLMDNDETPKPKKVTVKRKELTTLSNSIYFNFNEVTLTSEDYSKLDVIVKNKEAIRNIVLDGHTDNVGTSANNMKVSKLRLDSVVKYLVKNGVDPEIIKQRPFGEEQPAETNTTVEGRAKNRRVAYILD